MQNYVKNSSDEFPFALVIPSDPIIITDPIANNIKEKSTAENKAVPKPNSITETNPIPDPNHTDDVKNSNSDYAPAPNPSPEFDSVSGNVAVSDPPALNLPKNFPQLPSKIFQQCTGYRSHQLSS
mmetsp:Transcript_38418/g.75092  ORF Transcript_38418/g.75092 Transcript_38418/m.75092 type:complete len:125 (+) Transcript_38418:183-557(+)